MLVLLVVRLSGLSQGITSNPATLVLSSVGPAEQSGPVQDPSGASRVECPWLADLPTWMMGRTGAMKNGHKRQKCLASEAKIGWAGKKKRLGN